MYSLATVSVVRIVVPLTDACVEDTLAGQRFLLRVKLMKRCCCLSDKKRVAKYLKSDRQQRCFFSFSPIITIA